MTFFQKLKLARWMKHFKGWDRDTRIEVLEWYQRYKFTPDGGGMVLDEEGLACSSCGRDVYHCECKS